MFRSAMPEKCFGKFRNVSERHTREFVRRLSECFGAPYHRIRFGNFRNVSERYFDYAPKRSAREFFRRCSCRFGTRLRLRSETPYPRIRLASGEWRTPKTIIPKSRVLKPWARGKEKIKGQNGTSEGQNGTRARVKMAPARVKMVPGAILTLAGNHFDPRWNHFDPRLGLPLGP